MSNNVRLAADAAKRAAVLEDRAKRAADKAKLAAKRAEWWAAQVGTRHE